MEKFLNVEDNVLEENEKFFAYFNLFKKDWLNYDGNGQSRSNIRGKPCKLCVLHLWIVINIVGGCEMCWNVNALRHNGEECFNNE
jgi:hypothetical protein